MSLHDFPRYPLLFGPSPVHPLERLTGHLGGARIWATREDCNSGLAYGGNKTRKLEYIAPVCSSSARCPRVERARGSPMAITSGRRCAPNPGRLGMRCNFPTRAPSKRSLWDATITEILAGYYEPDESGRKKPESLYGSLKMWAHLQREGIPVAKSTVERLMRANRWQGVRRQRKIRTTVADPAAERAPDLVDRQFTVPAPNQLLVADFTYVKLVTGAFAYVAFVIDAYAGAIIGWEASMSKETRFGSPDVSVGHVRPGSAGQRPPRVSMAGASRNRCTGR